MHVLIQKPLLQLFHSLVLILLADHRHRIPNLNHLLVGLARRGTTTQTFTKLSCSELLVIKGKVLTVALSRAV